MCMGAEMPTAAGSTARARKPKQRGVPHTRTVRAYGWLMYSTRVASDAETSAGTSAFPKITSSWQSS